MPYLTMRLIGSQRDADDIIAALHGIDGIEHIEQIADLMPQLEDDSSSAGLTSDTTPGLRSIEIEVPEDDIAISERVREVANAQAQAQGVNVEFVETDDER